MYFPSAHNVTFNRLVSGSYILNKIFIRKLQRYVAISQKVQGPENRLSKKKKRQKCFNTATWIHGTVTDLDCSVTCILFWIQIKQWLLALCYSRWTKAKDNSNNFLPWNQTNSVSVLVIFIILWKWEKSSKLIFNWKVLEWSHISKYPS